MFFKGDNGTNITPDKIPGETIKKIIRRCDVYLKEIVDIMQIETVVGVGKYSKKRAEIALGKTKVNLKSCYTPPPRHLLLQIKTKVQIGEKILDPFYPKKNKQLYFL